MHLYYASINRRPNPNLAPARLLPQMFPVQSPLHRAAATKLANLQIRQYFLLIRSR